MPRIHSVTGLAACALTLALWLSAAAQAQDCCPEGCGPAAGAGCHLCDGAACGKCKVKRCACARLRGNKCYSCYGPEYGDPDLFRQYWVPPTCCGAAAQLYVAPQPVPSFVGHTWYTYEPLMPHELLHSHKKTYHRYYNEGRGLTRAKVRYYTPPWIAAIESLQSKFRIAR